MRTPERVPPSRIERYAVPLGWGGCSIDGDVMASATTGERAKTLFARHARPVLCSYRIYGQIQRDRADKLKTNSLLSLSITCLYCFRSLSVAASGAFSNGLFPSIVDVVRVASSPKFFGAQNFFHSKDPEKNDTAQRLRAAAPRQHCGKPSPSRIAWAGWRCTRLALLLVDKKKDNPSSKEKTRR